MTRLTIEDFEKLSAEAAQHRELADNGDGVGVCNAHAAARLECGCCESRPGRPIRPGALFGRA